MSKNKDHLEVVQGLVTQGTPNLTATGKKATLLREIAHEYVQSKQRDSMNGVGPRFVTSKNSEASPIYQITSNNVISVVPEKDIKSEIHHRFMIGTPNEINDVYKLIQYELSQHTVNTDAVAPVALQDDPQLAWNRLPFTSEDIHKITLDDIPEFRHFLGLCGQSADSLVLWTGSLLDAKSSRTQYLHIQSDGGNGKSTFLESLKRVFSADKVIAVDSSLFNDQYFGEALEGARILAFPDENNTSFFSSGKFKRFTGEDGVTINPKYKSTRNIRFTHKTIVLSNHDVQITSSEADVRRLVSVAMEKDSETGGHRSWYEGLKNSGEKILAYCYARYLEAVAKDPSVRSFIPVNKELIRKAIARKYAEHLDALYGMYEYSSNENDKQLKSEVHKHLASEFREARGKIFLATVKEALAGIGVYETTVRGMSYYKNLKKRSSTPTLSEKKI